jgi:hypothetical protein
MAKDSDERLRRLEQELQISELNRIGRERVVYDAINGGGMKTTEIIHQEAGLRSPPAYLGDERKFPFSAFSGEQTLDQHYNNRSTVSDPNFSSHPTPPRLLPLLSTTNITTTPQSCMNNHHTDFYGQPSQQQQQFASTMPQQQQHGFPITSTQYSPNGNVTHFYQPIYMVVPQAMPFIPNPFAPQQQLGPPTSSSTPSYSSNFPFTLPSNGFKFNTMSPAATAYDGIVGDENNGKPFASLGELREVLAYQQHQLAAAGSVAVNWKKHRHGHKNSRNNDPLMKNLLQQQHQQQKKTCSSSFPPPRRILGPLPFGRTKELESRVDYLRRELAELEQRLSAAQTHL